MTTPRTRVLQALNMAVPDRVPRDLGGMGSTGISAFAYPRLVRALGLPPRLPRVQDTSQMLALPDLDVLDALGCDVVTISGGVTNAFEQPEMWRPYSFDGRLPARVRDPSAFEVQPDRTITQGTKQMPPSSYVFDAPHGGQPLILSGDLPKPDLKDIEAILVARELHDEQIVAIRDLCHRVRESTDRAVFLSQGGVSAAMSIQNWGGIAVFPVLCLLEPDWVTELHEMVAKYALRNIRALLPEVRDDIDILGMAADDWGTQNNTIASPDVFRNLFLPYRRRMNDAVHEIAPHVKTFLHSCGAIYTLIDLIVESGFDILNPVQWSAGGHTYQEWKDRARGRLTLWGGGINSQVTLPFGTVEDVEREVAAVASYMKRDGGFVFCNIHNILAEIPADKIIAMYRTAGTV